MPFSMLHDVYEYLGKTSFGSGGAWARASGLHWLQRWSKAKNSIESTKNCAKVKG